jgi:hypothetical protein
MAAENTVMRQVWMAVAATTILFRVNSGKAWVGGGPPRRLVDGSVVLAAARPIALGFSRPSGEPVAGTSDLIGWTPVRITADMVGCRVAVFTSIETKKTKGGRTSDDQANFIAQVQRAGGIAGVASSPEAARQIVQDYRAPSFD